MKRVANFEKISYDNFLATCKEELGVSEEMIKAYYDMLKLPKRATQGSAGYDFYLYYPIHLEPKQSMKIPTGIRVKIEDGYFLALYPRSSLGFKYQMQLNNTVGIIDSDYYYSDNEGHIFVKIYNGGNKVIDLKANEAFVQGILMPFAITYDDDAKEKRNGGFGSTNE